MRPSAFYCRLGGIKRSITATNLNRSQYHVAVEAVSKVGTPPASEAVSKLMNATASGTEPGAERLHARERTLGLLLETT